MRRPLLLVFVLLLAAAPTSAAAQSRTLGSPLTQEPNGYGCEVKPAFTEQSTQGDYFAVGSGTADCTWYQAGVVGVADYSDPRTGAVPGDGRITSVAVRSGPNPAVLRFTILRLYADAASGNRQCCFFVTESAPVQPQANTISTFAVNLPVERNTNPANNLVTQDFIGVSGQSGTGILPLFSNGRNNTLRDYSSGNPAAGFFYPRLGSQANDGGGGRREEGIPGVEVLLRWTWCPNAAGAARAAQGCGSGGGPTAAAGATILGGRLRARRGRVALRVRCTAPGGCRGRVVLRTRGAKGRSRVLGSGRVNLRSGRTARVRLKLNRLGRRLARKRRAKVTTVLRLGGAGTVKRNALLTR